MSKYFTKKGKIVEKYKQELIEKRAKQFDKLCKKKGMKSVKTENEIKIITFQNGQIMKIRGAVANAWPLTEYEHKKKGLLF